MIPMTSHLPSGVSWYLDSAGAPNPHDTGHADKENDGVAARKQHGGLSERTSSAQEHFAGIRPQHGVLSRAARPDQTFRHWI